MTVTIVIHTGACRRCQYKASATSVPALEAQVQDHIAYVHAALEF